MGPFKYWRISRSLTGMLFKGIHEDSGRNVSINIDLPAPFQLPEPIVSMCRASESTSSESLPEVAKHFVTSVVVAEVQSRSNDEKVMYFEKIHDPPYFKARPTGEMTLQSQ
jgi:hypothetical protein